MALIRLKIDQAVVVDVVERVVYGQTVVERDGGIRVSHKICTYLYELCIQ